MNFEIIKCVILPSGNKKERVGRITSKSITEMNFELGVPWVAENKAPAPRSLFVKRFYGEFEEIQSKYDPSITANILAVKSRVCSIFEFQRHPTIGDAVTRNFENGRGIHDDAYTCRSTRIVRLVSKFDEKHHHRVSNFTFLKENPPFKLNSSR